LPARAGQRGLQVAKDGVEPRELRQVSWLAITDDDWLVGVPGAGNGGEAAQTVADDRAAWRRTCLGPLADGLGREPTHHAEAQKSGPVLVVQRHGGHERHFVLRAASALAARALAPSCRTSASADRPVFAWLIR
jgi:hypothetical protein